jgi:hypothetical protein
LLGRRRVRASAHNFQFKEPPEYRALDNKIVADMVEPFLGYKRFAPSRVDAMKSDLIVPPEGILGPLDNKFWEAAF